MTLRLITPPASEPITLAELKMQCRISGTDEDALLAVTIAAARAKCEGLLDRALITQTWEQVLDAFPSAELQLGRPPLLSIVSVKSVTGGVLATLDPAAYTADTFNPPGWALPVDNWPATDDVANAVRVQFTCGFGPAASDVPADIRAWLLLTAAYLYAQREAVDLLGKHADLPSRFVDSLLDPWRVYGA